MDNQESTKNYRTLEGRVVSDVRDKTITVRIERRKKHKIGKYTNVSNKMHAHDPKNEASVGDVVRIRESRPYSKTKSWAIEAILKKGVG